jgi:hypothetical protein
MEYKIEELLEFAKSNIKLFDEKYEMFLAKPEDLIGKKVISIRSGFTGGGGQVMVVEKLHHFKEYLNIILMPCEESSLPSMHRESHNGWSCRYEERCNSFIFYTPERRKIIDRL